MLPNALKRLRHRAALMVLREDRRGQGRHIDPVDAPPPDQRFWQPAMRAAMTSPALHAYADCLRPPGGGSPRHGVIDDLATYYGLDPDDVVQTCLDWEEHSVAEWSAAPRDTSAGLAEFYDGLRSWSFDLLWYAYLQTEGYGLPQSVMILDRVRGRRRLLDLGSGVGTTAQLFAQHGFEITLADVSSPLLQFAQWRLDRRGVAATYLHLPTDLPDETYDVVTALDVMAHVPDPRATAARLRRAMQRGGLFAANFDVRRASPRNAWHLYEDDLPLRWAIERSGFRPVALIDQMLWLYEACPTTGAKARLRIGLAWLRLASPAARAGRTMRRATARLALYGIRLARGARSRAAH